MKAWCPNHWTARGFPGRLEFEMLLRHARKGIRSFLRQRGLELKAEGLQAKTTESEQLERQGKQRCPRTQGEGGHGQQQGMLLRDPGRR